MVYTVCCRGRESESLIYLTFIRNYGIVAARRSSHSVLPSFHGTRSSSNDASPSSRRCGSACDDGYACTSDLPLAMSALAILDATTNKGRDVDDLDKSSKWPSSAFTSNHHYFPPTPSNYHSYLSIRQPTRVEQHTYRTVHDERYSILVGPAPLSRQDQREWHPSIIASLCIV